MGARRWRRLLLVAVVIGAGSLLWWLQSSGVLTLAEIQRQRTGWVELARNEPLLFSFAFFVVAAFLSALTVPGLLVLSVVAGNIFGLGQGFVLAWTAAGVGATLAFATSRFLLRDWIEERFARPLARVNAGFAADGTAYLLTLRLIPVFPAGLVNVLTALTAISLRQFFTVSLIGMVPAVLVYANAGSRLANLSSLADVVTPGAIGSLVLIGCLPLLGKFVTRFLARRRERGPSFR